MTKAKFVALFAELDWIRWQFYVDLKKHCDEHGFDVPEYTEFRDYVTK